MVPKLSSLPVTGVVRHSGSGQGDERMIAGDMPARLLALKAGLVEAIPCAPEEEAARAELAEKPLTKVLMHYMTWIDRIISNRPRRIEFAPGFWETPLPPAILSGLADLMQLFSTGGNLRPHLSHYAQTHGYVMQPPKQRKGPDWADGGAGAKDFAVNVLDVHHLHFTPISNTRRRGQSNALLFVNTFRDSVRFLMVGDHNSFDSKALRKCAAASRHAAGLALKGIGHSRQPPPQDLGRILRRGMTATETVNGDAVPVGAIALDGTSLWVVRYVQRIMELLRDWDGKLDTSSGRAELAGQMRFAADLEGAQWQLIHGDFCLVDRGGTAYVFIKWMR